MELQVRKFSILVNLVVFLLTRTKACGMRQAIWKFNIVLEGKRSYMYANSSLRTPYDGDIKPNKIKAIILYKQEFLHSDWLRACQLIPSQCKKVKLSAKR